jgi:signal transduction histidine kinase
VEHTEQVIYQSANILSLAKDMEVGSEGKAIFNDLVQLREFMADNPIQQKRVDSLNTYVHMRDTRNIRRIIDLIQQDEGVLLKERKQTNTSCLYAFYRFSSIVFVLMVVITMLLVIANNRYLLQNTEKQKRADELIIANKELLFQNGEKEKRAAELIIANKELVFQNDEKGRRAEELIIANKELAFQNEEKEKRAAELIIANKELAFQNQEKEKRAAELILVNVELKNAEDAIRKLNEKLEQKVIKRTAELETANKELESFSYSVSHDLRAPIRAINGYAQILEEDYTGKFDEDGTKALHSIMANSKKMGCLIDDLLAFSRLGREQVTVSEINMNTLVTSVIEELLTEDPENRVKLKLSPLPHARVDPALIKQVWINLISNAIKYSKYKPKTNIEIGASKDDGFVVYHVKDHGAGFDMQYYDKLFGVFQRLHSQEEFEGTGIGLAIVQKIVHRHNGTVWAESKPDEGTCFYFSLPDIQLKS